MRRPSALSSKLQEEIFGSFPAAPSNNTHKELDDEASSYLHDNSPCSDSESFSDESRKIRKKRNTYQKIPDDIRMQLLEAVQNGETLKAAAKRHKINYSSAKSILHTYRKEGRILKKSAQERSTKRRILSNDEFEQPLKSSKFSKKENVQPAEDQLSMKSYQYNTLGDKMKSDENGPMGVLKIDNYEHHYEENTEVKPLGEVSLSNNTHQPMQKQDDKKPSQAQVGYDIERMNQMEAIAAHNASRTMPKEDTLTVRPKMFDHFHMNYFEGNPFETRTNHGLEAPEFTNYTHYPREMESFSDMISTWQNRSGQQDEHRHGTDTHATTDHTGGDMLGMPFMNFLETQRFFQRAAVRKASFVSYGGSSTGFRRKESFDLF